MPNIPTWLIGKNVTAINVNAQTVSAGTLTPVGAVSLQGLLDEINWAGTNTTELIVPMDVRPDNEVIVGTGFTMTLVEILNTITSSSGPPGSNGNVLAVVALTYDYVEITFTRGGQAFVGYFVVGDYSEGYRRGKSVGTLNLKPCGITATLS